VDGLEQRIIKEGNILITEETNPINRIVRFQLKDNDKTLACAEIYSAGDIWIFNRIYVSEENRAKGYGSEVLTKLTAYLDHKKYRPVCIYIFLRQPKRKATGRLVQKVRFF
jgi:predicted GNAT family acetyltransferase